MPSEATKAEEILREFMEDVRAVGVVEVAHEWPDLLITYNKARIYFEHKRKDVRYDS